MDNINPSQLEPHTIVCKVCDKGRLQKTSIYKYSPPIAVMGYMLMLPDVLVFACVSGYSVYLILYGHGDAFQEAFPKPLFPLLYFAFVNCVAFVICMPIFVFGFLLRLKRSVLKCSTCGAIIDQH